MEDDLKRLEKLAAEIREQLKNGDPASIPAQQAIAGAGPRIKQALTQLETVNRALGQYLPLKKRQSKAGPSEVKVVA